MASQVDRLRERFLKSSREGYGVPEETQWPAVVASWEVANNMPSIYGLFRAAKDSGNPHREHDAQTLQMTVDECGFPSPQALLGALNQLRTSLKTELSQEDWEIFFGPTLDIE